MARNGPTIGTTLDGAFDVRVVGRRKVGDQMMFEMEASPRRWSWRYWLFRWRVMFMEEV